MKRKSHKHTVFYHSKESKKYYKHREKARNNPDKYLCVIIDVMDQAKTNVPQLPMVAKSVQSLWRLRTHITGTYFMVCKCVSAANNAVHT